MEILTDNLTALLTLALPGIGGFVVWLIQRPFREREEREKRYLAEIARLNTRLEQVTEEKFAIVMAQLSGAEKRALTDEKLAAYMAEQARLAGFIAGAKDAPGSNRQA